MVEAAKRAGAEAAERDMAADAERVRTERDDLRTQLDGVADQIEAAKKEAADAADRYLRLQADWDNYRRRTAAERLAERERAAEKLVTNLLPVLDDMERASAHAAQQAEGDERAALVEQAVKKDVRYMHYVLDQKQYRKYLLLLNTTLRNRGLQD